MIFYVINVVCDYDSIENPKAIFTNKSEAEAYLEELNKVGGYTLVERQEGRPEGEKITEIFTATLDYTTGKITDGASNYSIVTENIVLNYGWSNEKTAEMALVAPVTLNNSEWRSAISQEDARQMAKSHMEEFVAVSESNNLTIYQDESDQTKYYHKRYYLVQKDEPLAEGHYGLIYARNFKRPQHEIDLETTLLRQDEYMVKLNREGKCTISG